MKILNLIVPFLFLLFCFPLAHSDQTQSQDTALLHLIQVEPVDKQNFRTSFNYPKKGDFRSEQPPTIVYSPKGSKGYAESMAITDLSLCNRENQKATCEAFVTMITQPPLSIGTDVTHTRILGSDYTTAFLGTIDSVEFPKVERFIAFIGGDSTDPPNSKIVLYIYAINGTNLIQITTPVARCNQPAAPGISDVDYYKRYCTTKEILDKAEAKGKTITDLFHLK